MGSEMWEVRGEKWEVIISYSYSQKCFVLLRIHEEI